MPTGFPGDRVRIDIVGPLHGHLQGSGEVGRTNRTLVGLVKAFTKEAQPKDWDLRLERALPAYRTTVHAPTGVSPFRMLTCRKMRVPFDVVLRSKAVVTNNAF